MKEIRGRILDFSIGINGRQRITLEAFGDIRERFEELKETIVVFTLKKFRKKRSLDANGYAWALIDEIAEKADVSPVEVYRNAILNIGGVSATFPIADEAVEQLCRVWKQRGLGWQTEVFPSSHEGFTNVTLYYGSSAYDTKQMSSLISQLINEAENLGISTATPKEIAASLELGRG